LMIGDVVQCYSRERYDNPLPVQVGMHLDRGAPKSLFRPGSSTVVLIFEPGRVRFCEDILTNLRRGDVRSRYSAMGSRPLVETEVRVRSTIGCPARGAAR
jgi:phosphatidylserine decarboxylase